ncbi:uncharacterized protein N7446_007727 [Penicillium canescens]|uniref:Uncharacterized protein n=1 Tax=Penicillium canescens TaxID=5083 RepID=A0AAD6IM13_PENCN|nr:uncharacterized protein N7446_007727 [Penicillium canescens]KAJ6056836.1 hypothetical protein N7460_000110 [Penicillium canescens]KAJ6058144.1 hypothetical protein N7446_007727 [Penicillium canescens]
MYSWHQRLSSWAQGTGLKIDALGLVTLLGAEEMDRSIGRLVPSLYLDYLPLLGAFVVAGNRFVVKKPGSALCNISGGIMTTELAGWFSRWLQTQSFNQVRSIVTWEVGERPRRWTSFIVGFLLVGLPVHGVLIALTVLARDWWGFANVISMIASVALRCFQVAQNQAGIDANIRRAQEEAEKESKRYPAKRAEYEKSMAIFEDLYQQGKEKNVEPPIEPQDPYAIAKVIVVTEDSKVVTLVVPGYLPKLAFAINPQPPNPYLYEACQWAGWVFFAVHVVSIGMAGLYTQIVTVAVIIVTTVLVAHRVGCEDSRIWEAIRNQWSHSDETEPRSCWVSSTLKATVSTYPERYMDWPELEKSKPTTVQVVLEKDFMQQRLSATPLGSLESSSAPKKAERRQDLLAWLDLTTEQDKSLIAWGLIPHSREWQSIYNRKKEAHRRRVGV